MCWGHQTFLGRQSSVFNITRIWRLDLYGQNSPFPPARHPEIYEEVNVARATHVAKHLPQIGALGYAEAQICHVSANFHPAWREKGLCDHLKLILRHVYRSSSPQIEKLAHKIYGTSFSIRRRAEKWPLPSSRADTQTWLDEIINRNRNSHSIRTLPDMRVQEKENHSNQSFIRCFATGRRADKSKTTITGPMNSTIVNSENNLATSHSGATSMSTFVTKTLSVLA
jgi:hypothetical protein